MGFRLTVLLCAAIFLAMYFAPEGPRRVAQTDTAGASSDTEADLPRQGDPVADAAPDTGRDAEPARPPETITEAPSDDPPDAPPGSAPGAADPSDTGIVALDTPADAPDADPFRDEGAPGATVLSLPGLSGGAGSDAADALSLSDSVRNRAPDSTQDATDELLQNLLGETQAAPEVPAPPQPAAQNPASAQRTALVTATAVNLRAGPSTGDPVVGRVNFGTEVVLTRPFADGWAAIEHPDTGQEVFMASRFLQVQP
jgi:hypothetical protein